MNLLSAAHHLAWTQHPTIWLCESFAILWLVLRMVRSTWARVGVMQMLCGLTLNALVAADSVLIPIQCEFFALEGISQLIDTIERVKESFSRPLKIEGILLTMYDERTNLARQVAEDLREFFNDQVLTTVIPRSIRLAEAPSYGKPILMYDPRSRGAESYIRLAKEILANEQRQRQTTQSAG